MADTYQGCFTSEAAMKRLNDFSARFSGTVARLINISLTLVSVVIAIGAVYFVISLPSSGDHWIGAVVAATLVLLIIVFVNVYLLGSILLTVFVGRSHIFISQDVTGAFHFRAKEVLHGRKGWEASPLSCWDGNHSSDSETVARRPLLLEVYRVCGIGPLKARLRTHINFGPWAQVRLSLAKLLFIKRATTAEMIAVPLLERVAGKLRFVCSDQLTLIFTALEADPGVVIAKGLAAEDTEQSIAGRVNA